jgi:hypothetical protein
LIVLMIFALRFMYKNQEFYRQNLEIQYENETSVGDTAYEKDTFDSYQTYTYTNHGFSIELPNGFTPVESESEVGPYVTMTLPDGNGILTYVMDMKWWNTHDASAYTYLGTEKIGENTFSLYKFNDQAYPWADNKIYLYQKGNVGYQFSVNEKNKELLKTFKFVGWPQAVSLDLSTDYTKTYKTIFTDALQKPADFNGHYVVARYGCGSGCVAYGIVDKETGKVYQGPFDDLGGNYQIPPNFDSNRYSLNSNLFKVIGLTKIQTYKFENNKFILIN